MRKVPISAFALIDCRACNADCSERNQREAEIDVEKQERDRIRMDKERELLRLTRELQDAQDHFEKQLKTLKQQNLVNDERIAEFAKERDEAKAQLERCTRARRRGQPCSDAVCCAQRKDDLAAAIKRDQILAAEPRESRRGASSASMFLRASFC